MQSNSISACFRKPRGRSKAAPPTCSAKMVKVDREAISSSTSGKTFQLKLLGLAMVGGPDCDYWQGAASDTLSALGNSCRKKLNQDFLLTITSSGVHLESKKPAPWTLLHAHQCHQFQDISHWSHDLVDKKLFAYCIRTAEPRFYKIFCFRTCKKRQSGKRLSCAFDYAKCLWGSLQANREGLWTNSNRTSEDENLSLSKCLSKCVVPSDTTCIQRNPCVSARKLQRANSFPLCNSTPKALATTSSPSITSTTLPMDTVPKCMPLHAWTSKHHLQAESFGLEHTNLEPQVLPDGARSGKDKEVVKRDPEEGTGERTDQVKRVEYVLPIEAKCTQKSSDEITRKLQECISSPKTRCSNYACGSHELKPQHGWRLKSYCNDPFTTSMQPRLTFPQDHHGEHKKTIMPSCRQHDELPRSTCKDSVMSSTVDLESSLGGSMSIEFPLTEYLT